MRVPSATSLYLALSGLISLNFCSPGRCPGLVYLAPLGLFGHRLYYESFVYKRQGKPAWVVRQVSTFEHHHFSLSLNSDKPQLRGDQFKSKTRFRWPFSIVTTPLSVSDFRNGLSKTFPDWYSIGFPFTVGVCSYDVSSVRVSP